MRYIGNCQIDNVEYSTFFLNVVTSEFIKSIAQNHDLIEFLSETTSLTVVRESLKINYKEVSDCIDQNNIKYRALITDFSRSDNITKASKIKKGDSYAVNLLIEKGSPDETILMLSAGVKSLF